MMKRIVVAIDHGETCHHVFEQAIELARATEAKLNLISVLPLERHDSYNFSPYSDADWKAYVKQYQEAHTENLNLLKNFVNIAKTAGIDTDFSQENGSPGSAICKLAKMWNANLIIVGSHGRTGLSEMLLGSVSNFVVHHAPCSVMVVHLSV